MKKMICTCVRDEIEKWRCYDAGTTAALECHDQFHATVLSVLFPHSGLSVSVASPKAPRLFQPGCEKPCLEAVRLMSYQKSREKQPGSEFGIRPPPELLR